MHLSEWTLLALVVVVPLTLILGIGRVRLAASERAWQPCELRDAELAYAEQTFRADGEIQIVAKLDRGYRGSKGMIILVELKTRYADCPFLSDVIELSAQRLAVHMQTADLLGASKLQPKSIADRVLRGEDAPVGFNSAQ